LLFHKNVGLFFIIKKGDNWTPPCILWDCHKINSQSLLFRGADLHLY
jgi:hypothetical protein